MITLEAKNSINFGRVETALTFSIPRPIDNYRSNLFNVTCKVLCSGLSSPLQPIFSLMSLPWAWILINYMNAQFIQWFLTYWSLSKKPLSWPGILLYPLSSFIWLILFHSGPCPDLIFSRKPPLPHHKMWHPSRASWNFHYYSTHSIALQFSLYFSSHSWTMSFLRS